MVRGRLAAGATLRQAQNEVSVVARDFEREYPKTNRERGAAVRKLLRGLLQCVLLEPDLTHRFDVPQPIGAGPEGDALAALVAHCRTGTPPLTTAGVLQQFAGSPHESVLVTALMTGESDGFAGELLEVQLVEGIKRYWLNAQKHGDAAASPTAPLLELSAEETERARQRGLARQPPAGNSA